MMRLTIALAARFEISSFDGRREASWSRATTVFRTNIAFVSRSFPLPR